jgi:LacI family transcriptional regulator, galactose operon repressor
VNKPRATIKDIAVATGFSANTVSLALRGSDRLPEETRTRILMEAERLNYYPNRIARSLVHSATRTIGLILTDIMNPTLTLAARTIERELAAAGYAMMFAASDSNVDNEMGAMELFRSYQVDGMLVYPASHKQYQHIKAVSESGIPVLLLVDLPEAALDTVAVDDRLGAFKAFMHLFERGHRNIAMLDGGRSLGNTDKMQGAMRAVHEAGLRPDAISVFEPRGHSAAHGFAAMQDIMNCDLRPTALFASTDTLAIGALHWCRRNNIAIPEQMAVMGYDNTGFSEFGYRPLTTVNYAADEISRIGVDRILRRIENREITNGPEKRLIEPDLVVRETT